ncbi:preprotein translocase subunit YajC [Leucobacter sp. GX0328]
MDPITLVMFGLIAVLIFFMFRNGKKRQQAQQELQNSLRPGAEVMLQSGIFGTIESIDEESNRATVMSGTSTIVVHRSAISQVIAGAEAPAESAEPQLAPDDDPEFGERLNAESEKIEDAASDAVEAEGVQPEETNDEDGNGTKPQA